MITIAFILLIFLICWGLQADSRAALTERGVKPTPELPAGSEGMFRRSKAAAPKTPASPPRSVSAARPPLLAGEKPWAATWRNPTNRNLWRLSVCETGGINGGRPLWTHRNSTYEGALGFAIGTWRQFRWHVRPLPPRHAYNARPGEQYAVGRALVREFGGYSSWPSCSRRLGFN